MNCTNVSELLRLAAAILLVGGMAAFSPLSTSLGRAQTGEGDSIFSSSYDLSWWTVDGGGATFSTGGGYTLGGTIGQPDPGLLAGGDYTLGGGFWGGGVPAEEPRHYIYLPLIVRSDST